MLRGLYRSAAGMQAQASVQDVLSNNLANAQSAAFKRQVPAISFRSFWTALLPTAMPARRERVQVSQHTDFTQGELRHTGGRTDLALDGPGFLVVRTAQGERLIRGGTFHLDPGGALTDASGAVLLGERGPIRPGDAAWEIREDGTVVTGGQILDRLRVVAPATPPDRLADRFYAATDVTPAPPGQARVLQGWLERPNLDPVREMVAMIAGFRAYELSQRAVQAQDETLGRAVNDVGRLR